MPPVDLTKTQNPAASPPSPWPLDTFTLVIDRMTPDGQSGTYKIAGTGPRMVSMAIDGVIQVIGVVAAGAACRWWQPAWYDRFTTWTSSSLAAAITVLAALLAIHLGYHLLAELAMRGRSPGKVLCALRVVDQSGDSPAFRQLLVRNLLRVVDFLPLWYLLGGLLTVIREPSRRLGDSRAGTLVIHDIPLRDMLAYSETPVSVYSTSEDGYLLEAALARETRLSATAATGLAARLASYLHRTYAPDDPLLRDLYSHANYPAYLRALYRTERNSEDYAALPSGLPAPPPPVEE